MLCRDCWNIFRKKVAALPPFKCRDWRIFKAGFYTIFFMKEEYRKWYTQYLNHDIEMLVFGHAGKPLILFPTSMGRYYQNKDFGLIESIKWYIDEGLVRVYCPDSRDEMSWYNKGISPADRVRTHLAYERVVVNEVVRWAQHDTGVRKVIWAGASFGGYHAINTGLRYPDLTSHIFTMSGPFDMRQFMDGYYDHEFYYNNPMDFVGGYQEGDWLDKIRNLNINIGIADYDGCKDENFAFSNLLNSKGIMHWFDFRPGTHHDWPIWKEMLPLYLSKVDYNS